MKLVTSYRGIAVLFSVVCVCLLFQAQVRHLWQVEEVEDDKQRQAPVKTYRLHFNHDIDSTDTEGDLLIPANSVLHNMSEHELTLLYWSYVNTFQVLCRRPIRHGDLLDGGKEVCIDRGFMPRKPCLVYSFGSSLRFDFEDSIHRAYGCEIHTFDPSVKIDSKNRGRIPNHVTYHEFGLDGRDHVTRAGWRMKTLASAIRELQHEDRVIDILKIDAEGAEWSGFQTLAHFSPLDHVKQICIELHFGIEWPKKQGNDKYWGGIPMADQLPVLRTLYEKGFRIFMREHTMSYIADIQTLYGTQICRINEISLINLKWKK